MKFLELDSKTWNKTGGLQAICSLPECKELKIEIARHEYYVAEVALVATRALDDVLIEVANFRDGAGATDKARVTVFNCEGTDSAGEGFVQTVSLACGVPYVVYIGFDATALAVGSYEAELLVGGFYRLPVRLNVTEEGGNPCLLHRAKWLNSRLYADHAVAEGYSPISIEQKSLHLTGKVATLAPSGLLAGVTSYITESLALSADATAELFLHPMRLVAEGQKFMHRQPLIQPLGDREVGITAEGKSQSLRAETTCRVRYEGRFDYKITLTAEEDVIVDRLALEVAFEPTAARFMAVAGSAIGQFGAAKTKLSPQNNQYFVGNTSVGALFEFAKFEGATIEIGADGSLVADCGTLVLPKDASTVLEFSLLITPFKPANIAKHLRLTQTETKLFRKPNKLIDKAIYGKLRYINLASFDASKAKFARFVKDAHNDGLLLKAGYNMHELPQNLAEMRIFESLGAEILQKTEGTNCAVKCGTRIDNYFVESLNVTVREGGLDGITLVDGDICRDTAERVRKLFDAQRGANGVFDLEVAKPMRSVASLAFVDRVQCDCTGIARMSAEDILTELSGLIFGNTAILTATNPYLALLYGGTICADGGAKKLRKRAAATKAFIAKKHLYDYDFLGFWDRENPIGSDNENVKVSAYRKGKEMYLIIYNFAAKRQKFAIGINNRILGFETHKQGKKHPKIKHLQRRKRFDLDKQLSIRAESGMIVRVAKH